MQLWGGGRGATGGRRPGGRRRGGWRGPLGGCLLLTRSRTLARDVGGVVVPSAIIVPNLLVIVTASCSLLRRRRRSREEGVDDAPTWPSTWPPTWRPGSRSTGGRRRVDARPGGEPGRVRPGTVPGVRRSPTAGFSPTSTLPSPPAPIPSTRRSRPWDRRQRRGGGGRSPRGVRGTARMRSAPPQRHRAACVDRRKSSCRSPDIDPGSPVASCCLLLAGSS